MSSQTIAAWTQLYAAVGLLAAICSGCALLKTIFDIRTGMIAPPQGRGLRWLLLRGDNYDGRLSGNYDGR